MRSDQTRDQEITAAVAAALARTNAEAAIALARTASETAAALAQTTSAMRSDITFIRAEVSEIKGSLRETNATFVTQIEFRPIRNGFYLVVTAFGLAVLGGIFALIIKR